MKTAVLRILVLILFSLLPYYGYSQSKLKNGFKDVELGKHINSYPDFSYQRKTNEGLSIYKRRNQDLSLGNIKLKSVEYFFYESVLVEIKVSFDSYYFREIVDLFTEAYGYSKPLTSSTYVWSDQKVGLSVRDMQTIVFEGKPLYAYFTISDIQSEIIRGSTKTRSMVKDL